MRHAHRCLVVLGLGTLALGPACGADEKLTCDIVHDPMSCWAEDAAATAACLPSRAQPGLLSADRTTCTWPDATVTFSEPVPTDPLSVTSLDFTIAGPGGCSAHFVDTFMNRLELTVGGETDTISLTGGTYTLACGGGPSYSASFNDAIACGGTPTDGFEIDSTSVTFTLVSAATPSPLFTCMQLVP